MVSQDFENAYKAASDLNNASQDDMLQVRTTTLLGSIVTDKGGQLYALAKIARDEDISKVSKPGMFDLKVGEPFPSSLSCHENHTNLAN